MRRPTAATGAAAALLSVLLAGCTSNDPGGATTGSSAPAALTVDSGADACAVSATTAPSGTVVFTVTNSGSQVTEFYLRTADGLGIVGEVENVGPGVSRELVVRLRPGTYQTACRPGSTGEGIRAPFTVVDSGSPTQPTGAAADQLATANARYLEYVADQADELLTATRAFTADYVAGRDAAARAAYASARMPWERIEPVAESFGDLDPRMDLREADVEPGTEWTGWHLLEKDLWAPAPAANGQVAYVRLTAAQRSRYADQLVADTQDLVDRIHAAGFAVTADQISNGAKGLLDEVATGKVTGEEEIWSHTDLWDFQANVDGAREAFESVRDIAQARDATLAATLDDRFADVQHLLDAHRAGDGFTRYDALTPAEVRALASAVDALGEPLSQLTSAVVG